MKIKIETTEDIYGAFDFPELYDKIYNDLPDNGIFIELGTFLGKSASYFAQKIKEGNKEVTFATIDNFTAMPDSWIGVAKYQMEIQGLTQRQVLEQNLKDLKLNKYVGIIDNDTVEASKEYPNGLIDAVFIDADHSYEAVKADIEAWLPKIKPGGIIAGHDIDFPSVWKAVRETLPEFKVVNRSWFTNKG